MATTLAFNGLIKLVKSGSVIMHSVNLFSLNANDLLIYKNHFIKNMLPERLWDSFIFYKGSSIKKNLELL